MSFEDSADRNVEIWKIKKLIKSLELARGLVSHDIRRVFKRSHFNYATNNNNLTSEYLKIATTSDLNLEVIFAINAFFIRLSLVKLHNFPYLNLSS